MKKAILSEIATGATVLTALVVALVALVALLAIGGMATTTSAADATMHNCPEEGQWAIAVWTGEETDAGEALATCDIEVAYALKDGAWERYIPDAPEVNNMGPLNEYDGVIALGGPAAPVVPEPTNIEIVGILPEGCAIGGFGIAICSAGDGTSHARTGLHTEPLPVIDGVATKTWTQMAVVKEVCLYCGGEFVACVDVPKASGDAHKYAITVEVSGDQYVIPPRQHEYMKFYVGLGPDGEPRYARLGYGGKIPYNETCPSPARWEWHEDTGMICPGYPNAIWGAYRCDNPPEGEQYCNIFDR